MEERSLEDWIKQLSQGPEEAAEQAVAAIVPFGEEAIQALEPLTFSPQIDDRWWALRALAEIQHPDVIHYLITGLEDPDLEIRQCAALGICHHPDPAAIPGLIAALNQEDQLLRRLGAEALIAIGNPAVPALIENYNQGEAFARPETIHALAMTSDPQAVPLLFEALDDESAIIQYWAEIGLQRRDIDMKFFKP